MLSRALAALLGSPTPPPARSAAPLLRKARGGFSGPGRLYVRVRPTWIRCGDYRGEPAVIAERRL